MEIASSGPAPIRIAFVDDHPTLLRGIAGLFEDDAGYQIVGTGTTAEEAIEIAANNAPDILTLDLSMPGDVFAAIGTIIAQARDTKVIIFTAFANVEMALRAIDAGAHAFVLKGRPSEDLIAAITAVRAGELFVSPGFSAKFMAGFRNRSRRERELRSAKLSPREQQIVDCLLKAMSNKEIAAQLGLSEKTIKHYMTNLMNKLKVRSRVEVVLAAKSMTDGFADGPGDQAD